MDAKQKVLKDIATWPHKISVTTAFMQLREKYKVHVPTPQWLLEVYYFEKFRRVYKLPEGKICYGDKPDVILEGGIKKIGIEITNFYLADGSLPESEQRQHPQREAIISEAQQIYLANGGKGINLALSFDKAQPIQAKGRLAKDIADLLSPA